MNSIRELVSLTNIITLIIFSLPAIQLSPPLQRPRETELQKEDILSSSVTTLPDPVDPRYNLEINNPAIIKDDSNIQTIPQKSVEKSLKELKNNLGKDPIVPQPEESVHPDDKIDPIDQSAKDKKESAISISKTVEESANPTTWKQNEPKISIAADIRDQPVDNSDNKGGKVEIDGANDGSEASTTSNIIQTTEKSAGDTIGTNAEINEDKIGSNLGKEENSEPKGVKAQQLQDQNQDKDKKDKLPPVIDSQVQNLKLINTEAQLARNQSQDKKLQVIHATDNDKHNAKAQTPQETKAKGQIPQNTEAKVPIPQDTDAKIPIPQDTDAKVPIPQDTDANAQGKPKPESKTENPQVEASKTVAEASKTADKTTKSEVKNSNSEDKDSNSEDKASVSQITSNKPKNEIPKEERKKEPAEQNPVAETKDDNIDNPLVDDSGDKPDTKALLPKEDGEGSSSAQNNIDELDSRTDGPGLGPTNYDANEDGEKADEKGTGIDSNNDNAENMKKLQSASDASLNFPEQEDNHFFAYFVTAVVIFAIGYLLIHNKQKILGLIVEGRGGRRRRRSHVYKRLETDGSKFGQIF